MQYGKFTTKSAEETLRLGEKIGAALTGGELILLIGDLGSGKTQITKGIASGIGVSDTVISPTFTIERTYQGKSFELHHFDLYRTKEDRELSQEIDELISSKANVVVIEWPENLSSLMRKDHIEIIFNETDDDERQITISPRGNTWS